MMNTAVLCSGLLGLLLFGLGFGVSTMRARTKTNIGAKDDPEDPLFKWVRAHANAAEYCPMLAVLMIVVAAGDSSAWLTWIFWLAVVSRGSHAIGMITASTLDTVVPLRFAGAVGTYFSGLVLALAAIV